MATGATIKTGNSSNPPALASTRLRPRSFAPAIHNASENRYLAVATFLKNEHSLLVEEELYQEVRVEWTTIETHGNDDSN